MIEFFWVKSFLKSIFVIKIKMEELFVNCFCYTEYQAKWEWRQTFWFMTVTSPG